MDDKAILMRLSYSTDSDAAETGRDKTDKKDMRIFGKADRFAKE